MSNKKQKMQLSIKKEISVTLLFTALFLIGGLIHVVMGPWDFTSCIAQIYYSTLVLIWAVTINYRIVNRKVRQLMLLTAALFMLAFFLQMCRYRIFEDFLTASRYFWYGYYITIISVPVLFLFVVLHLHLQENEKPKRGWFLMLIPSLALIILTMTNDLHQLIFVFISGTNGQSGTYSHGMLFYAIYVWVIGVLILSLVLAIKQCHIPSIGKKLWMPLYFAAFGILDVLSMFDIPKIAGVSVWIFIECLAMVIIGMEEACIQLGLIPANSSYQMIVNHSNKPFIISDGEGVPVYMTEAAKEMFQRDDNIQILQKPISGGNVSWAVDLTDINELNKKLKKTTASIESRNELLKTENSLKEEQARLTARNTLYNRITEIVSPQINSIESLLEDNIDDSGLAKIAFLNAYIKRRSNMELLKSDLMHFPTEELASAIRESCEYLKLCGVNAMLHVIPECELSADTQLFFYEAFQVVTENCLDKLKILLVNITMHSSLPLLRMTLKTSEIDIDSIKNKLSVNKQIIVSSTEDDVDEITITIAYPEGETVT